MEVYTRLLDLMVPDSEVYVGEQYHPFTIESIRWKQNLLLLKFLEINDRSVVSELTNSLVYIKTDLLEPLADGEFYYHELIGMQVYEEGGKHLGELVSVFETGANDVYLVEDEEGREVLLPAIDDMILAIDPDEARITVRKMEWYGEGD